MSDLIDLRSDTVTRPSPGMRAAMASAEVGDDVLGDDPTVIALQEKIAAMLGKPAALFVPSGTMANQLAIGSLCGPGDELLCDRGSHVVNFEGGAVSALWGAQSLGFESRSGRGIFSVDELHGHLRPPGHHDDPHAPRQKLLCVEDTHNRGGGSVWPIAQLEEVCAHAHGAGLQVHLDGARIWNAQAASGEPLARIAAVADTVAVCLSKGLGTPAGSLIAAPLERIATLKRLRKRLGGGMRQSGILAAAGLYALEHNLPRIADDHANARRLAERLAGVRGLAIDLARVETNLVFANVEFAGGAAALQAAALREGVLLHGTGPNAVRLVLHLDVSRAQADEAAARIARAAASL